MSLTDRSSYRYAISASNINSITNGEFPEDCDLDLQYFPRREVRVFGMTANPNADSIDCNSNGIDDICEIESNSDLDCINSNSVIDAVKVSRIATLIVLTTRQKLILVLALTKMAMVYPTTVTPQTAAAAGVAAAFLVLSSMNFC